MHLGQGRRTAGVWTLVAALLLQGLSGVVGGLALVADPSGRVMQFSVSWLQESPFRDYLIPGLILLLILGVVPLLVVYGVWTRRRWALLGGVFVGTALLVWLGVEILIIGYKPAPPLQPAYGALGLAILLLALLPSVRRHLRA